MTGPMTNGTLIGLTSSATAGKDTFFSLLATHLAGRTMTRVAFADALKVELDPLFKAFGGTAFETDPVKKALIRPILVSHGMSQRIISNGTYWISKVDPVVRAALSRGETVVVTDVRFENEALWFKDLGGKLLYIERVLPDGTIVPPVNAEEAANDPVLRARADVTMSWPTLPAQELWVYVEKAAKSLDLS